MTIMSITNRSLWRSRAVVLYALLVFCVGFCLAFSTRAGIPHALVEVDTDTLDLGAMVQPTGPARHGS